MFSKLNLGKKKENIEPKVLNEPSQDEIKIEQAKMKDEEGNLESESTNTLHVSSNIKNNKELMNLILAVDQVVHQHQISEHEFIDLQNRYTHTTGQLAERDEEIRRTNKVVVNKDKTIGILENKITDNNLKFDQIMEDFNLMKSQLSNEIDDLKNAIDIEKKKYKSLNEQYDKELIDQVNKIKTKEEIILKLESENANFREQNEQITKENKYLLTLANDFTSRISASFLDYKDMHNKE